MGFGCTGLAGAAFLQGIGWVAQSPACSACCNSIGSLQALTAREASFLISLLALCSMPPPPLATFPPIAQGTPYPVPTLAAEAAVLRADNAALLGELEAAQVALRDLGQEHEAAVVAAEAGALCAEAEVARAQDAAGHMMALADQIQGMFALCEVGRAGP